MARGVAVTIAVQELLHEGVHPHATHDIEILDPLHGKLAIEAATLGETLHVRASSSVVVDDLGVCQTSPRN